MSFSPLKRSQPLAPWQMESATPVEVDTDLYWTSVGMARLDDHIRALSQRRQHDPQRAREIAKEMAGLSEEWAVLANHRAQLETQYAFRGWTRAWLVTSSDGHIHSGEFCGTFKAHTTCTLLPQASGWPQ